MPPITSPRRQPFHAPAPLARPVAIPGSQSTAPSSLATSFSSTPPSTGTSPGSFGRNGHHLSSSMAGLPGMHTTPYMVALAGWPEPVFVAEKRSRPTTPPDIRDGIGAHLEPLSREVRDGAPMMPVTDKGIGMTRSPSGPLDPARSRSSSPAPPTFPTSSARDVPLEKSGTPPGPLSGPLARLALNHTPQSPNRPRPVSAPAHGFQDPRFTLNAGARSRTLRVAPAWTSGSKQPYPADHVHPPSQPRVVVGGGTKRPPSNPTPMGPPPPPPPKNMRAVPEVVPPPKPPVTASAVPLATQVYPRDPDSPFAWVAGTKSAGASPGHSPEGEMDVDNK